MARSTLFESGYSFASTGPALSSSTWVDVEVVAGQWVVTPQAMGLERVESRRTGRSPVVLPRAHRFQMFGTDASADLTEVVDVITVGDRSDPSFIGPPVSHHATQFLSLGSGADGESSVAVVRQEPLPDPAVSIDCGLVEEPFFIGPGPEFGGPGSSPSFVMTFAPSVTSGGVWASLDRAHATDRILRSHFG